MGPLSVDGPTETQVLSCQVLSEEGREVSTLVHGESYVLRVHVQAARDCRRMDVGFLVRQPSGLVLQAGSLRDRDRTIGVRAGEDMLVDFSIPCRLWTGGYVVGAWARADSGNLRSEAPAAQEEQVIQVHSGQDFPGLADLGSQIKHIGSQAAPPDSPEGEDVQILDYALLDESGMPATRLHQGRTYTVRQRVLCHRDTSPLSLSYRMELPSGLVVCGLQSMLKALTPQGRAGEILTMDCTFPCLLGEGEYLLGGGVAELITESSFTILHLLRGAVEFSVVGEGLQRGLFRLPWEVRQVHREPHQQGAAH